MGENNATVLKGKIHRAGGGGGHIYSFDKIKQIFQNEEKKVE